jgi:hypothetical protein
MWRQYKRRVLLAMSALAFAQLDGINLVSYYARKYAATHELSIMTYR